MIGEDRLAESDDRHTRLVAVAPGLRLARNAGLPPGSQRSHLHATAFSV
jgi:hypothetical protein